MTYPSLVKLESNEGCKKEYNLQGSRTRLFEVAHMVAVAALHRALWAEPSCGVSTDDHVLLLTAWSLVGLKVVEVLEQMALVTWMVGPRLMPEIGGDALSRLPNSRTRLHSIRGSGTSRYPDCLPNLTRYVLHRSVDMSTAVASRPLPTETPNAGGNEFDDLLNYDAGDVNDPFSENYISEARKEREAREAAEKKAAGDVLGLDEQLDLPRKPRAPRVKLDEERFVLRMQYDVHS